MLLARDPRMPRSLQAGIFLETRLNTECDSEPPGFAELASWFWKNYLVRHTWTMIAAMLFMTVQGGMLGLLSYLIRPMFDEVFENENTDSLWMLGFAVLAVFVFRGTAGLAQRTMMSSIGERVKSTLQNDLMSRVIELDLMFFKAHQPGTLMEVVRGATENIKAVWAGLLGPGLRDLFALTSLCVAALTIDWRWTLIAVAGLPLLTFPIIIAQRVTRRFSEEERIWAERLQVWLDEILHNIYVIKLFVLEKFHMRRFNKVTLEYRRRAVRREVGLASVPAMVDVVAGIGFFGFLMIGGREVIEDRDTTIGEFMSFFTAIVLMFDPLKRLGNIPTAWETIKVSLMRVHSLYHYPAGASVVRP